MHSLTFEQIKQLFKWNLGINFFFQGIGRPIVSQGERSAQILEDLRRQRAAQGSWPHGWSSLTPQMRATEVALNELLEKVGIFYESASINLAEEIAKWLAGELAKDDIKK